MSDYDQEVKAIQQYNKPILDEFRQWLEDKNLSNPVIRKHVSNINLFTHYLVYYDPLKKLDEASSFDVYMFMENWYPRKVSSPSRNNVQSNTASLRKIFRFMVETKRINQEREIAVRETLKENKEAFLQAKSYYYS
jgi:hypothetical protein